MTGHVSWWGMSECALYCKSHMNKLYWVESHVFLSVNSPDKSCTFVGIFDLLFFQHRLSFIIQTKSQICYCIDLVGSIVATLVTRSSTTGEVSGSLSIVAKVSRRIDDNDWFMEASGQLPVHTVRRLSKPWQGYMKRARSPDQCHL